MTIAEGSSSRVVYKAYSDGIIVANTLPTSSVSPAATGGTILRRTTCNLNLTKDTYESQENRSDQQVGDFRHGVKRVTGSVNGEWSPGTYWDFFQASLRGTDAEEVSADQSDLTSVTASNSGSTFVFAGGNPHTLGFRVGDIIRFTDLSDADNNATNFLITAMGGTSTRTLTVYPAPDDMSADSAFSVTTVGHSLYMPSSGFTSSKFAIERYNSDIDVARLFTECRAGGFNFNIPATGLATVEFPFMGRDMEVTSAGSAPFFASPSAATTSDIFAASGGVLLVGGTRVGVVTGLTINATRNLSSPAVVGQNFVPEIFLGPLAITGQVTALFEDVTMINYFKNETEVSILSFLTTTSADDSPCASVFLPRVKFGGADVDDNRAAEQTITLPFTALKYATAGSGIEATMIRLTDSAAA